MISTAQERQTMNISEVAKLAGVSPSAVSRYLNNGYLSEEKKASIRRVIEETGYRPLVQAQILRTRKTKTVGVILPKIDSFAISSVVAGIDSVLEAKGFQDVVVSINGDAADVVVNATMLDDVMRAQIEDIVTRKTDIPPENIIISTVVER